MRKEEGRKGYGISLARRFFASVIFACVLVGTGYTGLIQVRAAATPPRIVMYQGRLLNSNGVPVSDTTASISFALYDASSGGTCLWSNNSATCASVAARTVTLTSGLFSEALGDTAAATPYAAIAATVFADNASVYLEVIVNGETLTPRKAMLAAPYAMNADALDGYTTTLAGATSAMVPVFTANGNLVITGSPQSTATTDAVLLVNPDTAVTATNEKLLSLAVSGTAKFTLDAEGDGTFAGSIGVNGGTIASSIALAITSGGDLSLNPGGSGLVSITTGDDFTVGAATLVAPFSVDVSLATIRFGSGSSADPILNFYASDSSTSAQIAYGLTDTFAVTGGNWSLTGLGTLPTTSSGSSVSSLTTTTLSGTSSNNLAALTMYGSSSSMTYSAIEGSGTTSHQVNAGQNSLTISGATSVLTYGNAVKGTLTNTATNASLIESGGYLSGVTGVATHNASLTTLSDIRGVYGEVAAANGTVTNAYAVSGQFSVTSGSITNAYAVYGKGTTVGTNRYGVYGEASGGTNNYGGYFTGGAVQIDADTSADIATIALTAGELYVAGDLESRGSTLLGDATSSSPTFTFSSAKTSGDLGSFVFDGMQSGNGFTVSRANAGGTDVTGTIFRVLQNDVGAGSTATAASITQLGAGSAIGLLITQATTSAHSGASTGANALVIDTQENGSSDDAIILRSDSNADGTGLDMEFRVTTAGDAYADGAFTGGGADFAEYFPTKDAALTDEQLVCQDYAVAKSVKRCEAGNTQIVGVISTNPAFIGNNIGDGTEDLRGNAKYRLVGLTGQVDTKVSTSDGAIAVGDPISASSTMAGYGAKAHGPVRIVGFALQALSGGVGTIRVLVSPQWYGGDVLTATGGATQVAGSFAIAATTLATASSVTVDSGTLMLRGSAWSGNAAETIGMQLKTAVSAVDDYRLSVMNTAGTEVASVGNSGDFAIAGRLYPSDRGATQRTKYLYYDGSVGSGGDMMRTNAAGWAAGSYDFAEMFPSADVLLPGEIVVFGDASEHVKRSLGEPYSRTIAGIVSTRPGFLAGENRADHYPIALAGRVPTLVSTENGAINIGDPLTTSTHPGYAMKATEPGPIVGYAAQAFEGLMGTVIVYVNVSYYAGAPVKQGAGAENTVSHLSADIQAFDTTGVLNFNGGQLLAIGSMAGIDGVWRLENDGDFITSGRLIELVRSVEGTDVETYVAATLQKTVQLSGTVVLNNGRAEVTFADIDATFTSIIDTAPTYRALITPYGATGALFVTDRTVNGFAIVESGAASSGVSVDWFVIATRRDYAEVNAVPVEVPLVSNSVETPSEFSTPSDSPVAGGEVATDEVTPSSDPVSESISDPAPVSDPEPISEPASSDSASSTSAPSDSSSLSHSPINGGEVASNESAPSSDSVSVDAAPAPSADSAPSGSSDAPSSESVSS